MNWPFRRAAQPDTERAATLSFNDYLQILNSFQYQGLTYSYGANPQEEIAGGFTSMARQAYKSNGVVFACMLARRSLFTEARLTWRDKATRDRLFGDGNLAPVEAPWPGGTTGDLMGRALDYADLAGNAYMARSRNGGVDLLRPDWVTIVAGSLDEEASIWDPDTEVLGYRYQPGGPGSGYDPIFYLAEEVAHFAPNPDPEARFLGMSWLTPIAREVMADKAMNEHKLKFMENGAALNTVVKLDVSDLDKFTRWIQKFREDHEGAENAYRTVFLGAGADVTVVGADLKQLDFKLVQGAGETRVAAAAGVPPVIVGLSEGLEAATYSNYSQARRRFADGTMWPLWRNFCGSLQRILQVPGGAELWIDSSGIPFLREDEADVASIQFTNAQAIKQLTDAGYTAESVIAAITANDLRKLEHSGLFSVQLQPPGSGQEPSQDAPPDQPKPQRDDESRSLDDPAPSTHNVNFNEGAFQLRLEPVIEIPERSVTIEPANVEVNIAPPPPAETRVEIAPPPPAEVNVTVEAPPPAEPARVEFAEGAIRVDAPPAANVEVNITPELQARLELDPHALRAEAPVINVNPTPVTVENTVNVPETPVTINVDNEPLDAEITFKRKNGQIESAKLTETDSGD